MTTNERVLYNTANWLMLEKCKEVGIDPSGSYCEQQKNVKGRRVYKLVKKDTLRPFIGIRLGAGNAPRFVY